MALPAHLLTDLDDDLPRLVELYQEFHAHPELSMQETWTTNRIEQELARLGLTTTRFGGTGTVAVITNGAGPTIAYRADTDGLPITEDTGLDYASTATGTLPEGTATDVMHGCGHDTHITVALGIAKLLTQHLDAWSGTAIMLFQPGEETGAGALAMLDDGLWDTLPIPEAIYGQHVWPSQAGTVDIARGTAMAMSDCLKVTVRGKQAHGSQPENAIDPIVLGAYMITRLQSVVSREISGRDIAVVTVGTFHGGIKENIIPDSAEFKLNIRTFNEDVRTRVLTAVERIIKAEAMASGAPEPLIEEMYRFPRCVNNEQLADSLITALGQTVGADNVNEVAPVTGSEDFGRLGDSINVPYVFWFFGCYTPEKLAAGQPAGNHSPQFAPDDVPTCLSTGITAGLTALLIHLGVDVTSAGANPAATTQATQNTQNPHAPHAPQVSQP